MIFQEGTFRNNEQQGMLLFVMDAVRIGTESSQKISEGKKDKKIMKNAYMYVCMII